jgi:hypothetical protein
MVVEGGQTQRRNASPTGLGTGNLPGGLYDQKAHGFQHLEWSDYPAGSAVRAVLCKTRLGPAFSPTVFVDKYVGNSTACPAKARVFSLATFR